MLTLYTCAGSRGLRARWTIEEIGLPCELKLPFPPRQQRRSILPKTLLEHCDSMMARPAFARGTGRHHINFGKTAVATDS
jgi:hypothetical protein